MNILILGVTSSIGQSIAIEFAPKNSLFLLLRDIESNNSSLLKQNILSSGGESVTLIQGDLGEDYNKTIKKIMVYDYDILINAASSTSNLNDNVIRPFNFKYYTRVDLLNPLSLLKTIYEHKTDKILTVIFISTVLSKVDSPNNNIYSSYKILHEEYIKGLKREYGQNFSYKIIYIGSRIRRDKTSKKTEKIARLARKTLANSSNTFYYGLEGKILMLLNNISPIITRLIIFLSRVIK